MLFFSLILHFVLKAIIFTALFNFLGQSQRIHILYVTDHQCNKSLLLLSVRLPDLGVDSEYKIIHFMFGLWDDGKDMPNLFKEVKQSWEHLNPTWKSKLWNGPGESTCYYSGSKVTDKRNKKLIRN